MYLYQYLTILKVYVLHITVISIISLEVKIILPVLLLRNLPELAGLLRTKSVSLLMFFRGWLTPYREAGPRVLELK